MTEHERRRYLRLERLLDVWAPLAMFALACGVVWFLFILRTLWQ